MAGPGEVRVAEAILRDDRRAREPRGVLRGDAHQRHEPPRPHPHGRPRGRLGLPAAQGEDGGGAARDLLEGHGAAAAGGLHRARPREGGRAGRRRPHRPEPFRYRAAAGRKDRGRPPQAFPPGGLCRVEGGPRPGGIRLPRTRRRVGPPQEGRREVRRPQVPDRGGAGRLRPQGGRLPRSQM